LFRLAAHCLISQGKQSIAVVVALYRSQERCPLKANSSPADVASQAYVQPLLLAPCAHAQPFPPCFSRSSATIACLTLSLPSSFHLRVRPQIERRQRRLMPPLDRRTRSQACLSANCNLCRTSSLRSQWVASEIGRY
jgi:hypothetical protein